MKKKSKWKIKIKMKMKNTELWVRGAQAEQAEKDGRQKEEAVRKLEEEVKALQSGNKIKDQFSATLCEKVSRL